MHSQYTTCNIQKLFSFHIFIHSQQHMRCIYTQNMDLIELYHTQYFHYKNTVWIKCKCPNEWMNSIILYTKKCTNKHFEYNHFQIPCIIYMWWEKRTFPRCVWYPWSILSLNNTHCPCVYSNNTIYQHFKKLIQHRIENHRLRLNTQQFLVSHNWNDSFCSMN